MLLRICLIAAILLGLAVGALNMTMVKDKITTIETQREEQRSAKETAMKERDDTKRKLATTEKTLAQTQTELTSTKEELATQTKRVDTLTVERDTTRKQLDDTRKERDDAKADLAAYEATGLKPVQILAMNKQYKSLEEENQVLASVAQSRLQKIKFMDNELAMYRGTNQPVTLPADLKGKILVTDPKWNFVVLNVGSDQGVLQRGELLVNRDGKLVAKVIVTSVQKERCVANVMPGWQLGEVIEGDQVIPAHPEPREAGGLTATPVATGAQVTSAHP